MSIAKSPLPILAFVLTACAPEPIQPDTDEAGAQSSDEFDQAVADAITSGCGAPNDSLWIGEDGEVHFVPPTNMAFETAACVLDGIRDSGTTKYGFVGIGTITTSESN